MTPDRWRQLTDVFHAALAREAPARAELLDERCGDDATLRAEVEAMLAAHENAGSFGKPITLTASQPGLQPGVTLGAYSVHGRIGAGGMGEVYRARDSRLDRDVAIKVLSGYGSRDPDARRRLLREARAAAALNHPHVCTVYEAGEVDGLAYIAMEFIEGQSLDRLVPPGGLPLHRALRYGLEITGAVAHAHDRGIVHRDLKTGNTMVTPQGHVKVLDFGLARRVTGAERDAIAQSHSTTTGPGAIVGTLAYMSPEQVRGELADARSDVWALGVVLFELITGARPFAGENALVLSAAILTGQPASLPDTVPAGVARAIERCLAKRPSERYPHAGELAAVIEGLLTGLSVQHTGVVRRRAVLASAGALVASVAIAILGGDRVRRWLPGAAEPAPAIRLAVLPFSNLTGDTGQEYLSDGLTEEMISQLGRLHPQRLHVIGRTSAMRYKRTDKSIDQIGRELGVDYVLEGSARREGSRVRITAQLVRVADQTRTWGEMYERELSGMFALQSEVGRGVARSLAVALLPAVEEELSDKRALIPEAYEAYLRGRQHHYRLTRTDLDTALSYYEQALAADPQLALAYTGIAGVWSARRQMGYTRPADATPREEAAVKKSLELDETSAESHVVLAKHRMSGRYDLAGAEQAYRRALEINPNEVAALAGYTHVLMALGRSEDALAHAQRAVRLDPYEAIFQAYYGNVLLSVRRLDEAIEQYEEALRTSPALPFAHEQLVSALHLKGRRPEAAAALRNAAVASRDRELEQVIAGAYFQEGYEGMWRRAADTLAARFAAGSVVLTHRVAVYYHRGGDTARALDWLEKAYEVRDPNLFAILSSPTWDALHAHPRFQRLRRLLSGPA